MPKAQHFHDLRLTLYPIVEVIVDPAQVNPTYARESHVCRDRSDIGVGGDEFERARDRVTKGIGSGRPVQIPPG
jgi:hypothetical protein